MKQSNALAYLRQLCCLGLAKEIVIPEFLRAVCTVIPSGFNLFSGVNEQLMPAYCIGGFYSSELLELYPEVNRNFWTAEKLSRIANWLSLHPVIADSAIIDEKFYKTDMYNLLFRRFDVHHIATAPVVQNGKPAGMLSLTRPSSQKPFNSHEQTLCAWLTPYLAHAMQASGAEDVEYCDNGLSGMLIMDARGSILFISGSAKNLLFMARYPLIFMAADAQEDPVMAKLRQLCRNLEAIFQGKEAAPPCWSYANGLGRFIFRAYWLDKQNREPGGLIGVTIEHQEPLTLKLLRAMQPLPLSPTQKEVALMLAQGASSEKIGERLHIKMTTVKDHVGKIFTKLDIHHREELLPKLLALESSMPIMKVW
jgi:DNA-binding CsgD family transcriptional regulator